MIPTPTETPDISIIVPVYNAAQTLDRCLGSITSSRVQNLEIICVNDGSTDTSAEILQRWVEADSRVRVFAQSNAGVSAARNLGLQHVQGRYLAFVDADDEITTDYLANLLADATQYDADLVVCGQQQHSAWGQFSTITLPFRLMPVLTPAELATPSPSVCSHLYATRVLRRPERMAQFPLGVRYGEDTAFHYALFPYCRNVVQSTETGYIIYYTEDSSNSRAAAVVFDMVMATAWLAEQYKLAGSPECCRECLVRYANHAIRRIHSLGKHDNQTRAAAEMCAVLRAAGISPPDLDCLKRKDKAVLSNILRGGNGLNPSYYFKRVKRWLKHNTHFS